MYVLWWKVGGGGINRKLSKLKTCVLTFIKAYDTTLKAARYESFVYDR